jgi:hypothetical protein
MPAATASNSGAKSSKEVIGSCWNYFAPIVAAGRSVPQYTAKSHEVGNTHRAELPDYLANHIKSD